MLALAEALSNFGLTECLPRLQSIPRLSHVPPSLEVASAVPERPHGLFERTQPDRDLRLRYSSGFRLVSQKMRSYLEEGGGVQTLEDFTAFELKRYLASVQEGGNIGASSG